MPRSRVNRTVGIGYQKTITDPDHPDYLTKCPLPIRVKLAGKQLTHELEGFFQFGDAGFSGSQQDYVDQSITNIVREHAIPFPIQVLEYARSMFMTKRLNPKNERVGIMDIEDITEPDVYTEADDIVKYCIKILNERIDG